MPPAAAADSVGSLAGPGGHRQRERKNLACLIPTPRLGPRASPHGVSLLVTQHNPVCTVAHDLTAAIVSYRDC